MAAGLKTTSSSRKRTEIKTFSEATLANLETAFATYEDTKATDDTKTWTVEVVNSFFDGTNFILIAQAYYPEQNTDPTGQVPLPV